MNVDAFREEIRRAKKSADAGHHRAALRRLGRLRKSIERAQKARPSAMTPSHRALLYSLEAGVHALAGQQSEASQAYLRAASVAFGDLWSSVDVVTNSLWAAELSAAKVGAGARNRVAQIRRLDDRGARLKSIIGDMLNDQLMDAGLPPIIFGGRYPARVAPVPAGYRRPSPYTRADKRAGLGMARARAIPKSRRPTTGRAKV